MSITVNTIRFTLMAWEHEYHSETHLIYLDGLGT